MCSPHLPMCRVALSAELAKEVVATPPAQRHGVPYPRDTSTSTTADAEKLQVGCTLLRHSHEE
jgi:hypothetical protein